MANLSLMSQASVDYAGYKKINDFLRMFLEEKNKRD